MLEDKLVLVGDDGVPLKPVNVDSQATDMEPFPSLSNSFRSLITSTKLDNAGDKWNGTGPSSYVDRLNGNLSKKVANFVP